jgi:hypothetical protein
LQVAARRGPTAGGDGVALFVCVQGGGGRGAGRHRRRGWSGGCGGGARVLTWRWLVPPQVAGWAGGEPWSDAGRTGPRCLACHGMAGGRAGERVGGACRARGAAFVGGDARDGAGRWRVCRSRSRGQRAVRSRAWGAGWNGGGGAWGQGDAWAEQGGDARDGVGGAARVSEQQADMRRNRGRHAVRSRAWGAWWSGWRGAWGQGDAWGRAKGRRAGWSGGDGARVGAARFGAQRGARGGRRAVGGGGFGPGSRHAPRRAGGRRGGRRRRRRCRRLQVHSP